MIQDLFKPSLLKILLVEERISCKGLLTPRKPRACEFIGLSSVVEIVGIFKGIIPVERRWSILFYPKREDEINPNLSYPVFSPV